MQPSAEFMPRTKTESIRYQQSSGFNRRPLGLSTSKHIMLYSITHKRHLLQLCYNSFRIKQRFFLCYQQRQFCHVLLNSSIMISGRKNIGSKCLRPVRMLLRYCSWAHLKTHVDIPRDTERVQVSWIEHHFYTSLFCFTQCALKISNNIAISIQSYMNVQD